MSRRDTSEGIASPRGGFVAILCGDMPIYHRIYSPGELQFITSSTNRRTQVFRSPRFCQSFVQRLEEVRQKMNCLLIGWVLMPEHFHLLLKPQPAESTPVVIKELKEETARRILKKLRENQQYPWCQKMLARFRLPRTVHDESPFRFWTVIPSAARNLALSILSAVRDSSSPAVPRNDSSNEFSRVAHTSRRLLSGCMRLFGGRGAQTC